MAKEKKKDFITVWKESKYDKIPLTKKQLDWILVGLGLAAVVVFILGLLAGQGKI